MADNNFSSTEREIICIHNTVQVLIHDAKHLVQHRRLRYEAVSQTGYCPLQRQTNNKIPRRQIDD